MGSTMSQAGIKDVARVAGVSYKTVSRVVTGEGAVRGETRRRVEEAITALGYRPNHSAQSLRRGRTHALRLILSLRPGTFTGLRFQDEVIAGASDRASRSGYGLLLELVEGDPPEERQRWLADRRADGTILLDGRSESPLVALLRSTGAPCVILVNPAAEPTFGSVDADFAGGAEAMVRHLLDLGHRRIAHLADDFDLHSSRQRRDGYLAALQAAGITPESDLIVPTGSQQEDGFAATAILFSRRPDVTALFCVNDLTAFGAIEWLTQHGHRVPEDISVTGYDDIAVARYFSPPLTTVHLPWYEMGIAAADLLIGALDGHRGLDPPQCFGVDLCPRGSTGSAPLTTSAASTEHRANGQGIAPRDVRTTKGGAAPDAEPQR